MRQDSIVSVVYPPLVSKTEPIKQISDTVVCGVCHKKTKEIECALLHTNATGIMLPVCCKCRGKLDCTQ